MEPQSSDTKLIEWLNTFIVMAQWDKSLPLYFGRLVKYPDQYQKALQLIRQTPPGGPLPEPAGEPLSEYEWYKLYKLTSSAAPLRQLFAGDHDPFEGGSPDEISLLSEVSDLTTDPQTMFYSRNGTFHLVLEAVRQRAELNTADLITDSLNKFYTLLDTDFDIAEMLYQLAGSNDWHLVLASLYDARDYTSDTGINALKTLETWNQHLNTELRSILLRPSKLFRAPKSLVRLAFDRRYLFEKALNSIPADQRRSGFELRQQVSNVAYPLFVAEAKEEIEAVEMELELLAVVARHYMSVRKFAKLDGLVYAWPRIAALAMANYANLEYVEDFFVERKPPPSGPELDARDARELYELCENNAGLIRFLRLRPYFKEIDENELRRYRPLAPVTVSDPSQPVQSGSISVDPPPSTGPSPPVIFNTQSRVCNVKITTTTSLVIRSAEQIEYEINVTGLGYTINRQVKFSVRKLLAQLLSAVGVASEETLQSVMRSLFSGTNADQVLIRAGTHLFNLVFGESGLEGPFANAFNGDDRLRLVISTDLEEVQYLPWEWLPRYGYPELLLSRPQFSLVRSRLEPANLPPPSLSQPIRVVGLFPNAPFAARDISSTSANTFNALASRGGTFASLSKEHAVVSNVQDTFKKLSPQIVHFEGYITLAPTPAQRLTLLFSAEPSGTVPVPVKEVAHLLTMHGVALLVLGRNESGIVYGNAGVPLSIILLDTGLPAVLAPIRAVDEVTARSFTTEFYIAFLAGNSLEQALHTARRKVASRGGDWTAFALFANPSVLDFFQPLPQTA